MGNSHLGPSNSLVYQIRYNDLSLTELGLTSALGDEELKSVIQALPSNRTIRSAVFFDAFTSHVLRQVLWKDFVLALVSVPSLRQVELLETSVPLQSINYLIQTPTLQTLAVTDGIELGTITPCSLAQLGVTLQNQRCSELQEFVWECKFPIIENFLDALLSGLAGCSQLKLLGLVNSSFSVATVPLLGINRLLEFCLHRRSTLETLDLSGCGLTDRHLQRIQKGLSESKVACVIQRLHLQRNSATKDGLKFILELVKSNSRLQILIADLNESLQETFEVWLSWNKHVREPLGREPARHILGCMILRMKEQPDFLFLLLQHYPDIYC